MPHRIESYRLSSTLAPSFGQSRRHKLYSARKARRVAAMFSAVPQPIGLPGGHERDESAESLSQSIQREAIVSISGRGMFSHKLKHRNRMKDWWIKNKQKQKQNKNNNVKVSSGARSLIRRDILYNQMRFERWTQTQIVVQCTTQHRSTW